MKDSMSFVKGLGAGMIAGAAAFAVGKVMLDDRKNIAKGSEKLIKSVGSFVDGIRIMFR